MGDGGTLFAAIGVASGLCALILVLPGVRNRSKPGASGFILLATGGGVYAISTGIGTAVSTQWILVGTQIGRSVTAALMGLGWLLLAIEYTDRITSLERGRSICVLYVAVLLGLAVSNSIHGLFYEPFDSFRRLHTENLATLAWGNVVVTYFAIVVGTGLILTEAVRSHGVRRRQSLAFVLAALPGAIFGLVSISGSISVDVTMLGIPLGTGILAWALFGANFLDIVPAGRATVVENMNDPVVVLDSDDRLVDSNEAARTLAGCYSGWEGMPVGEFFAGSPSIAEALRGDCSPDCELTVESDGTEYVFDLNVSALNTGARVGSQDGRVIVFRDVTSAARQRRQIERQNERLERLADVIAHDMRGPVSAGKKTTTLLRHELDDPEPVIDQSLNNVDEILGRLEEFVEHLPQLAQESTDVEPTTACDLETLATDSWSVIDTGAVRLQIVDTHTVEGDPSRLRRVFENLFRNSIDHNEVPVGHPTHRDPDSETTATSATMPSNELPESVSTDGRDVATSGDLLTTVRVGSLEDGFYVEDDGAGLPDTLGDDIFEYGTSSGARSGFGLAIVRTIIEAHGWAIRATDCESGGARFEVRIH